MRIIGFDLNSAFVFVQVVISESFSGAGRALGIPNSTVSDKVAELEKDLGVTLLTRTTRKLKLTDAGAEYFKKAETAIRQLQCAHEEASQSQKRPTGLLRITAPADIAHFVIMEAVSEYRRKYPEVKVELDFSNEERDLVAEGYDIAIRGGNLEDSTLMAKKVGTGRFILLASPRYLRTAPPLKHPRDLTLHKCIQLTEPSLSGTWKLRSSHGQTARVQLNDGISTNSFPAVKALVNLDEGIALMPNSLCKDELKDRSFIHVLPEWSTEESPVHLVYPSHRYSSPKVREILPLLEKQLLKLHGGLRKSTNSA